jgi:hypothetical protein
MGKFRIKTGAVLTGKKVEKNTAFHNAKLRVFLPKNTISCGSLSLPTKPLGPAAKPPQPFL